MPQPDWMPEEALTNPSTSIEILGRGKDARKSKTFIPDMELASSLGLVLEHVQNLMEIFRTLHAKHHTASKTIKRDGKEVVLIEPEVLDDHQLRQKYSCLRKWERLHQEQVEHFVSVGGLSIKQTTGTQEREQVEKVKGETSSGTDKATKTDNRWK